MLRNVLQSLLIHLLLVGAKSERIIDLGVNERLQLLFLLCDEGLEPLLLEFLL